MKKYAIIMWMCLPMLTWAQVGLDTIRVGLLLPLQAVAMERDKGMDRFVDFYTGALLAVYEKQDKGQPILLHTYDVGKAASSLEKILASGELDGMDMLIGPVYGSQVKLMSEWSKIHHVKTLLPFTSNLPDLSTNPWLLQFNPTYLTEAESVGEYIALHEPVHCILVDADSAQVPASIREVQRCIKGYANTYVYTTMQELMADSLAAYLKPDMENILLLNTERFANMRAVMPYLERAAQTHKLTLLSQYSWQENTIRLPQLYTTVFKQDMDTSAYEHLYNRFVATKRVSMHPCYDILGYDLMGYVLETVKKIKSGHGMLDEEDILTRYYMGLQSDIQFERVSKHGGYMNTHVQWIKKQ